LQAGLLVRVLHELLGLRLKLFLTLVLGLLLFSGTGYCLWVENSRIEDLQVQVQVLEDSQQALSAGLQDQARDQNRIKRNERVLNTKEHQLAKVLLELIQAVTAPDSENGQSKL
jgi:hypothetical protein